ncbi:hypothetical protein HW555_004817 [Spodoptera exigua]|uniref:Uncharacterized protein n=1 Tax=Spodoptera exigua TaxID=7107 RepID=A0A835GKF9_SPOEX|nr:hypothetical protein HW555_004817 [Spodoptera exigua]
MAPVTDFSFIYNFAKKICQTDCYTISFCTGFNVRRRFLILHGSIFGIRSALEFRILECNQLRQTADGDHGRSNTGDVDNIALALDEGGGQELGEVVHSPHVDPEHIVEYLHVSFVQKPCRDTNGCVVHEDV